jgi:TolA-binding protein
MRAFVVAAAVVVVWAGIAHAQVTSQKRFEAATALEAKGQFAAAADALEKLGREAPADPFAADALYEAAVVAEERLADPARARALYELVATKYSSNRLSRRARTRADFLATSLTTGEEPLREYQDILAQASTRSHEDSRARMVALLTRHPEFALADRALFWLGQRLAEDRMWDAAMARYLELERRFPSSEWALRARKSRGDVLLSRGHPMQARVLYRELAASRDPLARSAGAEGLADSVSWIVRAILVFASAIYLIVFAFVQLRAVKPRARFRKVPLELWYYAPVAAVFVAAAMTENRAIGWATAGIALGGAALVWMTSLSSGTRLEKGPMPVRARVGRAAAIFFAVGAVGYLSVQATGLTDIVVETFRAGPERG